MHFERNEMPKPLAERDSLMLEKDDVIIDEHGTPWMIQASDEMLAVLDKTRAIIGYRYRVCQLVWKDEKLKRHTEVNLIDVPAGKVNTYHPGDIARAVQVSISAFDAKLAAL